MRTLWHLSSESGRYCDKVEILRTVVYGHLLAFAEVLVVSVALVHKLHKWEASVHQHSFNEREYC